jgi:hypothetical protein
VLGSNTVGSPVDTVLLDIDRDCGVGLSVAIEDLALRFPGATLGFNREESTAGAAGATQIPSDDVGMLTLF